MNTILKYDKFSILKYHFSHTAGSNAKPKLQPNFYYKHNHT